MNCETVWDFKAHINCLFCTVIKAQKYCTMIGLFAVFPSFRIFCSHTWMSALCLFIQFRMLFCVCTHSCWLCHTVLYYYYYFIWWLLARVYRAHYAVQTQNNTYAQRTRQFRYINEWQCVRVCMGQESISAITQKPRVLQCNSHNFHFPLSVNEWQCLFTCSS